MPRTAAVIVVYLVLVLIMAGILLILLPPLVRPIYYPHLPKHGEMW